MNWRAPVLTLGAAIVGAAGASRVLSSGVSVPGCPFQALTGVDCPGCGTTRCLMALGRGDLWQAASHNLLVPLALVALGWAWAAWLARSFGHRLWSPLAHRHASVTVLVVVLTFWALRVTPGPLGAALAAGP